jgi:hypothetical protein
LTCVHRKDERQRDEQGERAKERDLSPRCPPVPDPPAHGLDIGGLALVLNDHSEKGHLGCSTAL